MHWHLHEHDMGRTSMPGQSRRGRMLFQGRHHSSSQLPPVQAAAWLPAPSSRNACGRAHLYYYSSAVPLSLPWELKVPHTAMPRQADNVSMLYISCKESQEEPAYLTLCRSRGSMLGILPMSSAAAGRLMAAATKEPSSSVLVSTAPIALTRLSGTPPAAANRSSSVDSYVAGSSR